MDIRRGFPSSPSLEPADDVLAHNGVAIIGGEPSVKKLKLLIPLFSDQGMWAKKAVES